MNNGSLSYGSLKSILLHTEANLRIQMNQRMPKIRHTEKNLPLKIDSLELEDYSTTINDSTYTFGIYRNFQTEETPQEIKFLNDCYGVQYDLDQYGFEIPSHSSPILPGDVSFREETRMFLQNDSDEREQWYKRELEGFEKSLRESIGLEAKSYLRDCIIQTRFKLLPFHYRRNNIPPPYSSFIRFTLTEEEQEDLKRVEHYSYNIKLFEAVKELNRILFDGRCLIRVNKFSKKLNGTVFRLPIGLKFSVNRITVPSEYVSRVASILDVTNGSLKELELCYPSRRFDKLQNDVMMNAERLHFPELDNYDVLHTTLEKLPKKNIKIGFGSTPTSEDYYEFIHIWMATKREIGSSCLFGLEDEEMGNSVLRLVRARNVITEQTERCITIIRGDLKRYTICVKENGTPENKWFRSFLEVSFVGVS
ncbi:unnamed protein product [Caenorhabditis nigoni]|uniref:Uncharacterized protein n=1 Tax=Caenorhabditis nigoni TaxID=1611254 RepID=A0A2G5V7W5_9PELO|nr:hypothetical protein B9Z55_007039 [Caenorhabditis nigoni]